MKAWIEAHPYAALFLVGVLLSVGSFAVGRFSARGPDIKEVEHVVYKDRVIEVVKTITVTEKAKTKVVYREKTTKPDGTIVERETEKTDTKTETKSDTDTKTDAAHEGARDVERIVTASKPDWRIGALVGSEVGFNPLSAGLVVGAQVERRIAGPFSLGLWTLVRPSPFGLAIGGSLAIEL